MSTTHTSPAPTTTPEPTQTCCDYRDHDGAMPCECPAHPYSRLHPYGSTEPTPVCVSCGEQMTTTTTYRCPACGTTSGR